jgi:hypothetical protein
MPSFVSTVLCACLGAILTLQLAQAAPVEPQARPSTGSIERIALHSALVDDRPIDVWLPSGYAERARVGHRYRVLYMHDGQMLFDPAVAWNKQSWHVDAALDRLMREGKVADTIIVGIWNNARFRASEYVPQKFLQRMPAAAREGYERKFLETASRPTTTCASWSPNSSRSSTAAMPRRATRPAPSSWDPAWAA